MPGIETATFSTDEVKGLLEIALSGDALNVKLDVLKRLRLYRLISYTPDNFGYSKNGRASITEMGKKYLFTRVK